LTFDLLLFFVLFLQLCHDRRISQSRRIAERVTVRDVAQTTAHDLATARLGEFGSKEDFIWPGDGADLFRQVTLQLI
jgi:hypothetical protein